MSNFFVSYLTVFIELGILVWQDFMFGCGQVSYSFSTRRRVLKKVKYPAYDAFVSNVKLEAVQTVQRLRHHPSIVILAGNNEGLAPFSQTLKINDT